MTAPRSVDPSGVVSVDTFFAYLSKHREQWPIGRIARLAKLPRSVVYRALEGGNVTVETLQRITAVLGAEVFIAIGTRKNRLRH